MRTLTMIKGFPQVKWLPIACIQLYYYLILLEKVETSSICCVHIVSTICMVFTVSDKQNLLIATYTKSPFKCLIYFFFYYQSS